MAIITKSDEKFRHVISELDDNYCDEDFIHKFIELYESDWDKVVRRYMKHERKSKGKPHPMSDPRQYILNVSYRVRNEKGK